MRSSFAAGAFVTTWRANDQCTDNPMVLRDGNGGVAAKLIAFTGWSASDFQ
jgi:hypothetical protein